MKSAHDIDKLIVNFIRKRFYKKTINKELVKPPSFIAWDCTRRCNLNCEHCGASKEKYETELSREKIKKVINDLSKIKRCFFGATGGEPLLRQDLLEILAYAKLKGLKTGFASNGFFINKKKAIEIKNANVDSIQISLDGIKETHNKIRKNEESFDRALDAIKNLQAVRIPILSVATTLTPNNFDELEKIYKLLVALKITKWRIGVVMPIGRAKNSKNLLLKGWQLKRLFIFIKKEGGKKIYIYIGENLPFLGNYEKDAREESCLCPVGIAACCIGVTGNVRGCPEQPDTPEFIEGNIKINPILEIWQNGFKKYRLNEFLEIDNRCKNCKEKFNCYGGCRVMRIEKNHCIYDLLNR